MTPIKPDPKLWGLLTERERYIVKRVSQGLADKEIAYEVGVCETTIHTTLVRLKKRIGGANRVDTILKLAGSAGLEEPTDDPEWRQAFDDAKATADRERRFAGVRARWGNDCSVKA